MERIKVNLYKISLIFAIALSVFSIIGNYIAGFSNLVNIKWIVLFLLSTGIIYYDYKKDHIEKTITYYFIFIIFLFLPVSFIQSGGSKNNTIAYIFLINIAITYLFRGKKRIFFIVSIIMVYIIMKITEHYYPQIIMVHPESSQYIDRLIQVPLILFVSFLIIRRFSNEYDKVSKNLKYFASFDELTSLYNRRTFNEKLENAINSKKESQLILLDLDNFKYINDTYGHLVGDNVLVKISDILKKRIHNKHIICRWGGDEFAIIYYGSYEKAEKEVSSIKKSISSELKKYRGLDISEGIISLEDYNNETEALKKADKKLYAIKEKKKVQKT